MKEDLTLKEIRDWLASLAPMMGEKKPREWLAKQLRVSLGTVNGWFSGRPIPEPTVALIQHLMRSEYFREPRFTVTEAMAITRAVESLNYQNFAEFARDVIMEKISNLSNPDLNVVAEDPNPYNPKPKPKP
jgi:hypothetical protein